MSVMWKRWEAVGLGGGAHMDQTEENAIFAC